MKVVKQLIRYTDNLIGWAFGAVGIAIGLNLGKDIYGKLSKRKNEISEDKKAQ